MTYDEFAGDRAVHDAVLYNLLVIGEAVKHLPSALTDRLAGVRMAVLGPDA